MPRKVFTAGEVLAAADVNEFLQDQAIMTFAGTAARASAISTATATEGMVTYLADTDTFEFWDGTAYQPFGGSDVVAFDYLVIGGGGGGGSLQGGGGAGGYRNSFSGELSGGSATAESPLNLLSGSFTVTIGAGGAGGASGAGNNGVIGSSSFFGPIVSVGGGPGGAGAGGNGFFGASGGGSSYSGIGGASIPRQGQNGGNGFPTETESYVGGGGGGAQSVGGTAVNSNTPGAGGAGLSSSASGSAVSRGGGGGGAGYFNVTGGAGGTGGGGAGGGNSLNPVAGTVNTGGGGGAGGTPNNSGGSARTGGAGGSGLVILKYPSSITLSIGGGLTSSTSTSGDFKTTIFTAGTDSVSF